MTQFKEPLPGSSSWPTYGVGFDPGNGATKIVVVDPTGQRVCYEFPSVLADGNKEEVDRMIAGSGRDAKRYADEWILSIGGREIFGGYLPLRQSRAPISWQSSRDRYSSEYALHLLLIASGAIIPEEYYRLIIGTGMPVDFWSKLRAKEVQQRLCGEHAFTLNKVRRCAQLETPFVIMEGFGALISTAASYQGSHGIVDIGRFTTDVVVCDTEQQAISTYSGSIELGISNLLERWNARIHQVYETYLTEYEQLQWMRAFSVQDGIYPEIWRGMTRLDQQRLATWFSEARQSVGDDIANFVSSKWSPANHQMSVKEMIPDAQVVGRGAHLFFSQLKAKLPHLHMPSFPQFQNALGYSYLVEKDIPGFAEEPSTVTHLIPTLTR